MWSYQEKKRVNIQSFTIFSWVFIFLNHYKIVYYKLSLLIVNVGKCDHFFLLNLYNIFKFYEVVIIYLSLFYKNILN